MLLARNGAPTYRSVRQLMSESAQPRPYHSLGRMGPAGLFSRLTERKAELALGIAGAAIAGLFFSAPLSIALVGGVATFALSALEVEPFLLLVIFLLPVVWVVQADLPLRNVPIVLRSVVVAGFFLGRLLRGQVRASRLLRQSLSWASLLFVGAVLASGVLTQGLTYDSLRARYEMVSDLGFYFMILAWVDSQERFRKVSMVLLCSTAVTLGFAIIQELAGGFTPLWFYLNPVIDSFQPWNGRAASFMNHPNSLAAYLNMILPFSLACYVVGKGKWRKLGGCLVWIGFAVLLSSQSIGGIVAFGSVLVLAIFCFVQNRNRRLLLLVGICGLALGFYIARETLNPAHAGDSVIGYDAATRFVLWSTSLDLFVHSPITGIGWGNFPTFYGSYVNISWIAAGIYNVHNIYLQLLSETGILGFVAFLRLVFVAAREAWRRWRGLESRLGRSLGFGVLGAILTLLVQGLVDSQFTAQMEALFWTLLALLAASGSVEASERVNGIHAAAKRFVQA